MQILLKRDRAIQTITKDVKRFFTSADTNKDGRVRPLSVCGSSLPVSSPMRNGGVEKRMPQVDLEEFRAYLKGHPKYLWPFSLEGMQDMVADPACHA